MTKVITFPTHTLVVSNITHIEIDCRNIYFTLHTERFSVQQENWTQEAQRVVAETIQMAAGVEGINILTERESHKTLFWSPD